MQTVVGENPREDSSGYLWQVPGRHLCVHLSQAAVRAILKGRRPSGGQEIGGVLLGRTECEDGRILVKVEQAVEVPSEHLFGPRYSLSESDQELLEEVVGECARRSGSLIAVGFYRTHRRKGLRLDDDDLAMFEERFPGPDRVALVVKRRYLRASPAGFFFREEGQVHSGASYKQLRLRAGRAPKPNAGRRRAVPLWCSWWAQAPLFACLLTAYALLGFASARQWNRLSPNAPAPHDPYGLSLLVLEYGDNLHLSWDRRAPAIAAGGSGLLHIRDGDESRTLELTPAQLRSGSVAYRKISSHVQFRLEVFLKQNRSVSETWESSARPTP